jgi:hypothetical protein
MATLPSTEAISAGEIREHLDRILNSETLRRAPNLCHFLDYVVTRSAGGDACHIKESVIAIEVFGRRGDFDGRIDNIVRVQAHRLRKLLETYYAEEGKYEPLRLCIPRGSYVPQVAFADSPSHAAVLTAVESSPSPTAVSVLAQPPVEPSTLPPDVATERTQDDTRPGDEHNLANSYRRFSFRKLASYATVFVAGGVVAALILLRSPAVPGLSGNSQPSASDLQIASAPALTDIWKAIFEPDVKTIIAFTSPRFLQVGRSHAYLLYFGPLSAPEGTEMAAAEHDPYVDKQFLLKGEKLYFSNGWSGTGEVLAVNRLTALAAQFRQSPNVIPSRALTLNEARMGNVIFIGAPIMNGMIAKIGTESAPMYATEDGKILLRHPISGEPAIYENIVDPATGQIKTCYALFSVLPGVEGNRKIVTSAGLGSWATWGAIEFLTKSNGASQLAGALKAADQGKLPHYYQAVVRTDIIDGSVANQALMATRVIQP